MDRNIHPGLWKSVVQEQGIASCLKCAHKIYSNLWCQTGPNSLDPSVRGYSRWVLPVDVKLLQVWPFSELQYLIINTTLLTCTYTATKEKSQCEFTATYWLLYLVHIAINKSYCIQQKNQHTCTVHKLLKKSLEIKSEHWLFMNGNIWSLHMLQFTRYILYMYLQNNTQKNSLL